MVDLVGIEPTTSSMPWKRAPSCATGPHEKKRWESCSIDFHSGSGDSQTARSYFCSSVIQREMAVTALRGAKRTDSATSQFFAPEITSVLPFIRPR